MMELGKKEGGRKDFYFTRILSAKDDTGTARFAPETFLMDGLNLRGPKGTAGDEPYQPSMTQVHQ
jgi:hypothetical protein